MSQIAKFVVRVTVLLGLAGLMAVNAMAGAGTVPDPNGTSIQRAR